MLWAPACVVWGWDDTGCSCIGHQLPWSMWHPEPRGWNTLSWPSDLSTPGVLPLPTRPKETRHRRALDNGSEPFGVSVVLLISPSLITRSVADPGGLWGPEPPLPPRVFFKWCSFQAILGKNPILSKFWAQPPLGSKLCWPPWPKSWIRACRYRFRTLARGDPHPNTKSATQLALCTSGFVDWNPDPDQKMLPSLHFFWGVLSRLQPLTPLKAGSLWQTGASGVIWKKKNTAVPSKNLGMRWILNEAWWKTQER